MYIIVNWFNCINSYCDDCIAISINSYSSLHYLLIMPRFDQYYIVEFRMPIKVDSISTVQEALSRAKQVCENQFGFKPENWNARIFEYSTGINEVGHVKEYFYNPNSSNFREIQKNIAYFNDLVEKSMSIDDIEKGIIRGDIGNGKEGIGDSQL